MLVTNASRGVISGFIALLVFAGRVELSYLIVAGFLFGSIDALFYPAQLSILPSLVPDEALPAANSIFQASQQLAQLVGPAIAGVTVAALGTGIGFAIDAASFLVATVAIFLVRGGNTAVRASDDSGTGEALGILASVRAGLAYSLQDKAIPAVVALSSAGNVAFAGALSIGLPVLVRERLGAGSDVFGVLFAAFGAGTLVGVLAAGALPRPRDLGAAILVVGLVMGLGFALVGVAPGALAVGVLLASVGVAAGWTQVTVTSWLQARVPAEYIGRVMSTLLLGSVGLTPLALLVAGAIADVSVVGLYFASGGLLLVAVAFAYLTGAHRAISAPTAGLARNAAEPDRA